MFIWTIGDAIFIFVSSFIAGLYIYYNIKGYIKQKLCKHERTYKQLGGRLETICKDCGKNFGFKS